MTHLCSYSTAVLLCFHIRMPETKNVPGVTEFFVHRDTSDSSLSCKLHICYVHSGRQKTQPSSKQPLQTNFGFRSSSSFRDANRKAATEADDMYRTVKSSFGVTVKIDNEYILSLQMYSFYSFRSEQNSDRSSLNRKAALMFAWWIPG